MGVSVLGMRASAIVAFVASPTPINECEDDYAISPAIAEFYCCMTSCGVMLVMAAISLKMHSFRAKWLGRVGTITALSSVAYHITLWRGTLALDQLALAFLGAVMLGRPWLGFLGVGAFMDYRLGAAAYVPITGLGVQYLMSRILRRKNSASPETAKRVHHIVVVAVVCAAVGLVSFAAEIVHVETRTPCSLPFHAAWHVLAGVGLVLLVCLVDFSETGSLPFTPSEPKQ